MAKLARALPGEVREWFTAAELAELGLPGMPADKRGINRRARDERWHLRTDGEGQMLARPRAGRGGGTEFHLSLLPGAAQLELADRGISSAPSGTDLAAANPRSWHWFDLQSEKTKAEAHRRTTIVAEIEMLRTAGMTGTAAVTQAADRHGVSTGTLWNWLSLVDGVPEQDRLPALAPRRRGGGVEADIDALLWAAFRRDYLRPEAPTIASCYERVADMASERGLSLPSQKTFLRRLKAETDPQVIRLAREGEEALRRSIPAQRRTVEELHALEAVNIDGHKFDVWAISPEGKVIRPLMVTIQDIYSSKILAWRLSDSESALVTRLAFADLFEKWGIPKACLLDNGRAFASKWITGGATTRFRFKVKPDEPVGILTALGIRTHWATPYRGQSKPIERAFRDLAETISKTPAFHGAYTGKNPTDKPENYRSRAVSWTEFCHWVEIGIARHNAKLGRQGRHYRGRSFDDVFAESYAVSPIGKASPEQLRMALLSAEQVTVNRETSEVRLFGNRYWSEGCAAFHGQRVTVRFDPDNLQKDIHLYGADGRYLTSAQLWVDAGFFTQAEAVATKKREKDYRRRIRDGLDAEREMTMEELVRLQAGAPVVELPVSTVTRPVRHRGQTAAALKPAVQAAPAANEREEREKRISNVLRIVGGLDQ